MATGKGKRTRAQRQAAREWAAVPVGRDGSLWRRKLIEWLSDEEAHAKRELDEHLERMKHAGRVMHEHTKDPGDTFEAAWTSFARPLIRQGFASGLDVSALSWQEPNPDQSRAKEILDFAMRAIEVDRQCDLTALTGPLYVISPEVHVVIAACATTLSPAEVREAFVMDELPALAGMIVLPERAPWVGFPHTRAITWQRLPTVTWDTGLTVPSMRFKAYSHSSIFHKIRIGGARLGIADTNALICNGCRDIEPCFGDIDADTVQRWQNVIRDAIAQRRNTDHYERADAIGQDANAIGEARLDSDTDVPMTLSRYFAAFSRIVDQESLTADPLGGRNSTGEHPARRQQDENDIQIVRLRRRPANTDTDNPRNPGNWSHRWVVQMHKVRQWYPSEGRHKIIWRGPYLKGPAGAPLQEPRERIHAVVR